MTTTRTSLKTKEPNSTEKIKLISEAVGNSTQEKKIKAVEKNQTHNLSKSDSDFKYQDLDSQHPLDPQNHQPIKKKNAQEISPRSESLKSMMRSHSPQESSPRSEKGVTINPMAQVRYFKNENQHLQFFSKKSTPSHHIQNKTEIPVLNLKEKKDLELDSQQESPTSSASTSSLFQASPKTSPKQSHLEDVRIQNKILNFFSNLEEMEELIQHPTRSQLTNTLIEVLDFIDKNDQGNTSLSKKAGTRYALENMLIVLEQSKTRFENHIEMKTEMENILSKSFLFSPALQSKLKNASEAYFSEITEALFYFVDKSLNHRTQVLEQYQALSQMHLQTMAAVSNHAIKPTFF